MSNLPVNFSDDILNASMNGRRRYQMITNSDGTVSFLDVTNYDNFGSDYGAAEVNELNKIVNGKVEQDDVLQTLEQISANTDSNKIAGATALKELNNKTVKWANMEPVWLSSNIDFANGQGTLKVTDKTLVQTYLTCNTIMDNGAFSAVVIGKSGSNVRINAYNAGVPYTGMLWVVTSGLIQVR